MINVEGGRALIVLQVDARPATLVDARAKRKVVARYRLARSICRLRPLHEIHHNQSKTALPPLPSTLRRLESVCRVSPSSRRTTRPPRRDARGVVHR